MKINVAQSAGFCFGVKRAIKTALDTARESGNVEMLGDIVHNEKVVRDVEVAGIRKIKELGDGSKKTLLIQAHGVARRTLHEARRRGYRIVDATCPMVKEIHTIAADLDQRGLRVIIIGDACHDEVRGICGQVKSPVVIIDSAGTIPWEELRSIEEAGVVVQSTQRLENMQAIVEAIRPNFKKLEVHNTICQATTKRQKDIKLLPAENDVVLVIGSRSSANTQRLYEISRGLNPRTYWIQSERDITLDWFAGARSIGITAGASTPQETIEGIVSYLKKTCCS